MERLSDEEEQQRLLPSGNSSRTSYEGVRGNEVVEPNGSFEYGSANGASFSVNHEPYFSVVARGVRHRPTQRYQSYQRLRPELGGALDAPDHALPPDLFLVVPLESFKGGQSSWVTVFSLWNSMMGISLLTLPWAVQQAGFLLALPLVLLSAVLSGYTCWLVVRHMHDAGLGQTAVEFSDIIMFYLGSWAKRLNDVLVMLTHLCGLIIYWIFMSDFLYMAVLYVAYPRILAGNIPPNSSSMPDPTDFSSVQNNGSMANDLCFANDTGDFSDARQTLVGSAVFHNTWHISHTVPAFLIFLVFPLLSFKSVTFFTKFNALGLISVFYVVIFIVVKAANFGVQMDTGDYSEIRWNFPALTGILAFAFNIHNGVIGVMRNQRHPQNNLRDLVLAFSGVVIIYMLIGVVFVVSFPVAKSCLQPIVLDNFEYNDVMAFSTRVSLFFQILTLFPLLAYVLRAQLMQKFFGSVYPGFVHVLSFNVFLVIVCIAVSCFFPNVGTILRFSGAIIAVVAQFSLPCVCHMMALYKDGLLTWRSVILHSSICLLGVLNLIGQFAIL